jgi:hypothetical protein
MQNLRTKNILSFLAHSLKLKVLSNEEKMLKEFNYFHSLADFILFVK